MQAAGQVGDGLVEAAWDAAGAAAASSRVVIDTVADVPDLLAVIGLFDAIWGTESSPPIGLEHLRALAHAGNYIAAARDAETGELLGASVAFFAAPSGTALHSDITGVATDARDRRLGHALKLDQRAWALERGIAVITWTYDPLIARNAHFNLSKLRASAVAYHVDFYGEMDDGINRGQGSDRVMVRWDLAADGTPGHGEQAATDGPLLVDTIQPLVVVDDDGPRVQAAGPDATHVSVAVPPDIEALRRSDPARALAWRHAVRDTLGRELAAGGRVLAFDRESGYLIERARP